MIPPKNCINSCPAPTSLPVLSDWPRLQHMSSSLGIFAKYLLKMAAKIYDCLDTGCSKWLPILNCLAIGCSKWLPILGHWLLKMAVKPIFLCDFKKYHSLEGNSCQVTAKNGCRSRHSLVQTRPMISFSKWLLQ